MHSIWPCEGVSPLVRVVWIIVSAAFIFVLIFFRNAIFQINERIISMLYASQSELETGVSTSDVWLVVVFLRAARYV